MKTTKIPFNLLLELFAYASLLIAAFIYAFWREPNTYFSFLFYKTIGLDNNIFKQTLPTHQWLIYNLPSGLWVVASTLLSRLASRDNNSIFLYLPIFLVLLIEFLQFCKITDGVFDWLDVGVSVIGFILAAKAPVQVANLPQKHHKIAYYASILIVPLSDVCS